MTIIVRYRSIDRYSERRKFKTLDGARKYAAKWVGSHPDLGSHYAVSDDGVGKITVTGVSLAELFPDRDARARVADHIDGFDRDDLGESPDY